MHHLLFSGYYIYFLNKLLAKIKSKYYKMSKDLYIYAIICKSYYHQLHISIISSDTNFKLSTDSINVKNKQIYAYHKLLKIPQSNFNYPYLVLIPKFHKSPVTQLKKILKMSAEK